MAESSSDQHNGGRRIAPRVLIIGGQFAGRRARLLLKDRFDVTLVDAKGLWEYTPGVLRCLVQPEHAHRILAPQPSGTVHGTVEHIITETGRLGGVAVLADGVQLPFTYCIIATGSTYSQPIKAAGLPACSQDATSERTAALADAAQRLRTAASVVVVGGGAVGVELAAEVAGAFRRRRGDGSGDGGVGGGDGEGKAPAAAPPKRVTLVSSSLSLLPHMPAAAGRYAQQWLQAAGVELLLGQRVVEPDWSEYASATQGSFVLQTDQGYVLKADLVYDCTGARPTAPPLAPSAPPPATTSSNTAAATAAAWQGLQVLPTLQVPGHDCVFVCGDAMGTRFERTALLADLSANLAAANVARHAAAVARAGAAAAHPSVPALPAAAAAAAAVPAALAPRLLSWPWDACAGAAAPPRITCISLHSRDGILQFNGLVLTGWLAAWSKAAIEWLQVAAARSDAVAQLWLLLERLSVFFARFLFVERD